MAEHELDKLLGGFAADQLTAEERQLLYSAALQDQELFNRLADEQALKELLADPAVRRRLLHALTQARPSSSGSPPPWLAWLRRPAGLALAGGLAGAALAVVLGTKIYQDSLNRAADSAVEDSTPTAPAPPASTALSPADPLIAEPQAGPEKPIGTRADPEKKPAPLQRPAPSTREESHAADARKDELPQDRSRGRADAPAPAIRKAAPPQRDITTPALSARALFYGTGLAMEQTPSPIASSEQAHPRSPRMGEPPLQESQPAERSRDTLKKFETRTSSIGQPLGIRYGLIMRGPGEIDLEVDPSTPVSQDDGPRLTLQTNESGYLSVRYARSSSDEPTTLFPSAGEGHVAARQPIIIPLAGIFEGAEGRETTRLHIVFSRAPHSPGGLPSMAGQSAGLLVEHVDPGQPGTSAEQAVYIVHPDVGSGALRVEVPLSIRP